MSEPTYKDVQVALIIQTKLLKTQEKRIRELERMVDIIDRRTDK